ncbi:16465_t:CDS:2 [Acaulospora colombiana]|uniref:16465_t:CDS:1 n=1 Tax=Acaulospora colombiana TaxID=27376 RepID=A0ACA9LVE2_9GLOM|nr:16465_t:CDS:2 [Acaulospora colombiana]
MTSPHETQPQRSQSFEGHRFSGQDGGVGIEVNLQQLINERNLLRSQNDQLWKIIERQKTVITNLQKDNQKLTYERDRLVVKLKDSDISLNRQEDGFTFVPSPLARQAPQEIGNSNHQSKPSLPQKIFRTQEQKRAPFTPEMERRDSEASQPETSGSLPGLYGDSDPQYLPPVVVSEPSPVKSNGMFQDMKQQSEFSISQRDEMNQNDSLTDKNHARLPQDLEQNFQTSKQYQGSQPLLQNPPSPSISIKSSESGSLSSGGVSQHKRHSTIQTIDTDLDSPKFQRSPEPLSLPNSPRNMPPRSPGLPSSPRAFLYGAADSTKLQRRSSEEQLLKSSRVQSLENGQTLEKPDPVRSQSYPQNDETSSKVVPGGDSESGSNDSQRDSLTHNHSDPNLGNAFLESDNIPKDKSLRTSKSFSHISQSPRNRVSVIPPVDQNPAIGNNTLFIPGNQGKRHSVLMQQHQSQEDIPPVESVIQHTGNKESLPDANIMTGPSNGRPSQPQISQQSSQLQISQQSSQPQISQQSSQPQNSGSTSQQSQSSSRSENPMAISSESISGIAVKVVGSNKKINDKGKEVLSFIISVGQARVVDGTIVGMEKELWRVEKYYSDFLALDAKRIANKMKKLPDKNLFYNNAPSKVDQRKIALEQYIQHVISLPMKDSKDLCEFLSANVIEQDEKDYQQSGFKEGYLTKKGKNFGGWKSRYFVLDSPIFKYYESVKSDAERDEWVEALLQYVGVTEDEVQEKSKQKKDKRRLLKETIVTPEQVLKENGRHDRKKGNNDSISSTNSSMLSLNTLNVGTLNVREDDRVMVRSGTPEPRESSLVSSVVGNPSSQSSWDVQSHDLILEKKDRKNSRKTFFGNMFGSSHKDDKKKYQDPRPDPSRVVFGVPLEQAISVVRIKEGYELPAVVYRCIEYLDAKNASEEEGIYRLSGATATIKLLKERFNTEGDVDLLSEGGYDVHAVAGLLKLYLRELPTSVLTRELHMEFLNVIDLLDRRDRINELGRLVSTLPLCNYTLLRTLASHLIQIVQKSDINKMTVRNIGIVFAPSLGIPAGVFSLLMAEFDYIFFTDSDGSAAPRTIEDTPKDEPSTVAAKIIVLSDAENSHKLKNNSNNDGDFVALSPTSAFRRRDIRDDLNGRSNRNSVHYMDGAPEIVVGLERKLTGKSTFSRNDSSDDEVDDLALQAEEDDVESISSASFDDRATSTPPVSVPTSPRNVPATLPRSNYPSSLPQTGLSDDTAASELGS